MGIKDYEGNEYLYWSSNEAIFLLLFIIQFLRWVILSLLKKVINRSSVTILQVYDSNAHYAVFDKILMGAHSLTNEGDKQFDNVAVSSCRFTYIDSFLVPSHVCHMMLHLASHKLTV